MELQTHGMESLSDPEIRCSAGLLGELFRLAVDGFRRYPWGGVEIGGVLLGRHEPEHTLVLGFRTFDCEHGYGPSFELTVPDMERFAKVIEDAASSENATGLVSVGWYHTISRGELSLSEHDRALHRKLFSEPRHLAMVVRRSKTDPPEVGFFAGTAHGNLQLHSPARHVATDESARPKAKAAAAGTPEASEQLSAPAVRDPLLESNRYAGLGLNENPFSGALDMRFLQLFSQHRKAVATMLHKIQTREGFVALIGAPGVGKSLLLECLMGELKTRSVEFAYLSNSTITVPELYELVAHDLDLKCEQRTKVPVLIALNEYLIRRFHGGQTTALIVDNSEQLSVEVLKEIQLIGNLEAQGGRLLQVVFAAQPELEQRLRTPELRGLRQRMLIRSRLGPLEERETTEYISKRLEMAGLASQAILSSDLMLAVHRCAYGVPRFIDIICGNLLELCLERKCRTANQGMLDVVTVDLDLDAPVSSVDEK